MEANRKLYIFICGAPRSGTTACEQLLNTVDKIAVLGERYSGILAKKQPYTRDLFTKERMATFKAGDSFWNPLENKKLHDLFVEKYDGCKYVGDKIPTMYEHYDLISKNFEQAVVIFMSRNILDVAASYNRRARDVGDKLWSRDQDFTVALRDWNRSHDTTVAAAQAYANITFIGVDYETIFFDETAITRLLKLLDLSPSEYRIDHDQAKTIFERARRIERERKDELSSFEKREICRRADFDNYRRARSSIPWIS
jgi:hypothetical protein